MMLEMSSDVRNPGAVILRINVFMTSVFAAAATKTLMTVSLSMRKDPKQTCIWKVMTNTAVGFTRLSY